MGINSLLHRLHLHLSEAKQSLVLIGGGLRPLGPSVSLGRDYFSVPVDDIPSIKVLLTVVGGKVSYQDPKTSF